jgi:hypothetical protein
MIERCLKIKTKIMTHKVQWDEVEMLEFSEMIRKLEEVRRTVEEYNSQILWNLTNESANDERFEIKDEELQKAA